MLRGAGKVPASGARAETTVMNAVIQKLKAQLMHELQQYVQSQSSSERAGGQPPQQQEGQGSLMRSMMTSSSSDQTHQAVLMLTTESPTCIMQVLAQVGCPT